VLSRSPILALNKASSAVARSAKARLWSEGIRHPHARIGTGE
jgi:hypothetical protein